ncbi:MAG: ribosomal protein S18-alanine N-acetyltransferase [Pseudomonadaceae bacterium]|nr:ribosomal protein S18-alanine N-acetyltransferase [Pseudomonadaceae bacterium]
MLPDDLDQVMVVETRSYSFPWTHGIFSDCLSADYECWVLEHPKVGQLAGHAVLNVAAGESHLLNICVLREYQGSGLGRLLLNHVVKRAGAREAERVFLEVRPTNRSAIALYKSAGFEEIGIRKNYYPSAQGHEDAQVMALTLPKPACP